MTLSGEIHAAETRDLFSRGLFLLLGFGLALFLVLGGLAYSQYLSEARQDEEMRRSSRSLAMVAQLGQAIFQMESEQRGYLLTSNPLYVSGFAEGRGRIAEITEELEELTTEHPQQAETLIAMQDTIGEKIDELETTVGLAEDGRSEAALAIVKTDLGKRLMEQVRQQAFALRQLERQALETATLQQRRARLALTYLAVASLLAGLILSAMTIFLLLRNGRMIALSMQKIAHVQTERDHAEHEQERVELMLEDMNHRIGNSLGMVSALLGLQRSQTDDVEIKRALDTAKDRITAVATAHRRLRLRNDLCFTDCQSMLRDMASDLRETQPNQKIRLATDFVSAVISDRDAVTLGLLMSELVTNAYKHAFVGRESGMIFVKTQLSEPGLILTVEDDGVGLPSGNPAQSGMGSMIVTRMSQQYGGSVSYLPRPKGGTRVVLTLPGLQIEPDSDVCVAAE